MLLTLIFLVALKSQNDRGNSRLR